jgi:citrate lyase subunit beta/citryl-CoA lyase
MNALPTVDSLYVAKMQGLYAARAANILPLGVLGSVAGIDDLQAYEAMLKRSRDLGFACATCVHPSHIPILNAVFSPSPEELKQAHRLIAAYEEGISLGKGAVLFEGTMVDKPVAMRAYRLLERVSR